MTGHLLDCSEVELDLGVLLVGALDPDERADVEEHLRGCPSCAATLAELAPLPGLLSRVEYPELALTGPPADVIERVVAAARAGAPTAPDELAAARRRRWKAASAGLAAAASVALLLGVAITRADTGVDQPQAAVVSASNPATSVSARVAMDPVPAGTEVTLRLAGVKAGQRCSLVVVSHDGSRDIASSWVANYEGEADIVGTTGFTTQDIARFEVTVPDGSTLVDIPA